MRRLPLSTALGLSFLVGCTVVDDRVVGDPEVPEMEEPVDHADAIDALVEDLGEWAGPMEAAHDVASLAPKTVNADGRDYSCIVERHDVRATFDRLPAAGDGSVVPGLLVQGASMIDGAPRAIGLDRAPVTLETGGATVTVEDPNAESLAQAVETLRADATAVGSEPTVASAVVDTFEAAALAVGLPTSYTGSMVDAGLAAAFEDRGVNDRTVVVSVSQELFTVAFQAKGLESASELLAEGTTIEQVEAAAAAGELAADNLPAYISDVTYGRAVVFTVTSDALESGAELIAAVNASLAGSMDGEDAEVASRWSAALQGARVEVLNMGAGSGVIDTLKSGAYADLLGAPDMDQAVALGYQARAVDGTPIALGDEVTYEGQRCAPSVEGFDLGIGYVVRENAKAPDDLDGMKREGASSELSLLPSGGDAVREAIHFDGFIHVTEPGTYRFTVQGDDLVQLSLGNIYIHDDWQGMGDYASAEIELEAGMHPISVFYWAGSGDNLLRVTWASVDAGIPSMEVPSTRLWRAAT